MQRIANRRQLVILAQQLMVAPLLLLEESESDRSRAALIAAAAVAAAAITDTSSSTDDQALTEVASAADEGLNDWQNALIVIALIILVGVARWYIYNRYIVNIEDKKR